MAAEAYRGHSEELGFSTGETVAVFAFLSLMETIDITKRGLVFLGKGAQALAKIEMGIAKGGGVSVVRSVLETKTGNPSIHPEIVDVLEHPGEALEELMTAITLSD